MGRYIEGLHLLTDCVGLQGDEPPSPTDLGWEGSDFCTHVVPFSSNKYDVPPLDLLLADPLNRMIEDENLGHSARPEGCEAVHGCRGAGPDPGGVGDGIVRWEEGSRGRGNDNEVLLEGLWDYGTIRIRRCGRATGE